MEKVIALFLLLSLGVFISCSFDNESEIKLVEANHEIVYDTIFFETNKLEIRDNFLYSGAIKFEQGLLLASTGKGKSIWVDSVFYGGHYDNGFFAIVSSLDFGCSLLYYNGDSLKIESAGFKKPIIKEFIGNTNRVVCVTDSIYASGYLNKAIICYKLDANGVLKDKQEFFPKKKEGMSKYDFDITFSQKGDQFFVLKNDTLLVHYDL